MNSAEALNSMFRAPDLSDILGERYPDNSPDVYAWGNTFLGFSLVPDDEVVYDMNAEELTTLTEKTGLVWKSISDFGYICSQVSLLSIFSS